MNEVVYFHGIRVVYVWTAMYVEDHFSRACITIGFDNDENDRKIFKVCNALTSMAIKKLKSNYQAY